ncbi:hypothetical protein ACG7TL_008824 [Trametes sanguinea]
MSSPLAPTASPKVILPKAALSEPIPTIRPFAPVKDETPSICTVTIPSAFLVPFPTALILDTDRNNWHEWRRKVLDNLTLSGGLHKHLRADFPCPDASLFPLAATSWRENDNHVLAYIHMQSPPAEVKHMDDHLSAATLWLALEGHHIRQGPHVQVLLLRNLHDLHFDLSKPLVSQADHTAELCERIVTMGTLDASTLTKVALLHMMQDVLPAVQAHRLLTTRSASAPDTALSAQMSKRVPLRCSTCKQSGHLAASCYQPVMRPTKRYRQLSHSAHTRLRHSLASGKMLAGVCDSLRPREDSQVRRNHTQRWRRPAKVCKDPHDLKQPFPAIWERGEPGGFDASPGSAMEGRKAKVDAQIAARKAAVRGGVPCASAASGKRSVYRDSSGRAYFLDNLNVLTPLEPLTSASGTVPAAAVTLVSVVEPAVNLATDSIAGLDHFALTSESLPASSWLSSADAAGDTSYESFLALVTPLRVSLDWGDTALLACSAGTEPFKASTHLSPTHKDFTMLASIAPRGIRSVNGSLIYTTGIGTIHLNVGSGKQLILENVLYVPQATVHLISVRALRRPPWLPGRHSPGSPLFALSGSSSLHVDSNHLTARVPTLETWHQHLSHANYSTTHANGTPAARLSEAPPKCDACILGKQTRSSVPKVREGARSTVCGKLFFIDPAGDQCTRSASGNIAPLNIIDNYSSYGWSFPVPSKDRCAPVLRDFIIARRAEGCPVKAIQVDNGECLTNNIRAVCAKLGVTICTMAPYMSAHNSKVERAHRTYMGKCHAMRIAAGIPENRWDELYITACYLTNHTPSSSLLSGVTPYEAWHGSLPSLSHLWEIGCQVFVLIPTHNPKLRPRSLECVLIGYGSNSKTYCCYHRATHRILLSYHVSFIESHESPSTSMIPMPCHSNSSFPSSVLPPCMSLSSASSVAPSVSVIANAEDNDLCAHSCLNAPVSSSPLSPSACPSSSPPSLPTPPPSQEEPRALPSKPHVCRPSERLAASMDIPYTSRIDQAVADAIATGERVCADRAARRLARVEESVATWSDLDLALAATLQLDSEYDSDPTSLRDALCSPFAPQWHAALADEFKSLHDMHVHELIPRSAGPAGHRIMHGKPVFHLKRDKTGAPVRFKARWVCCGYKAVWGQDYTRTTSPTMRMESLHILLHLAGALDWDLHQVGVKTAFLYGLLADDEACFIEQPEGFEEPDKLDWVWRLCCGIYGLPHGGLTWNRTMHAHLVNISFSRLPRAAGDQFKAYLCAAWTISDLGDTCFIVGLAIDRNRNARTVAISQTALIDKVISHFKLDNAVPVNTPMDASCHLTRRNSPSLPEDKAVAARLPYHVLVGSLNYIAVGSHPDISFAMQQLAQFLDCYGPTHWEAMKCIVRYIKGTRTLKLVLGGSSVTMLIGYSDSDWGRCPDSCKSMGGYCFFLGSGAITWAARKQATVSASTTEAEYIAAHAASQELVWLRAVLLALGFPQSIVMPLHTNNTGTISLSKDPANHSRTKHIDMKHHILHDYVESQFLSLIFIRSEDNVADIFTKPLAFPQFSILRGFLGLQ